MIAPQEIKWLTPADLQPGQEVLVHILWSPHPEHRGEYIVPPPSPTDEEVGYWAPSPAPMLFDCDDLLDVCRFFTRGFVNLFQDNPDVVMVEVLNGSYPIPASMPMLLCEVFPEFAEWSNQECECEECGYSSEDD